MEHEVGTYNDALAIYFESAKGKVAPEEGIQKKVWTGPIFDEQVSQTILKLEPTDVRRFNPYQDKFEFNGCISHCVKIEY